MLEKSNNVDYVNKVKPMFIVELSCVDYGDKVNILTLFNELTICSLDGFIMLIILTMGLGRRV